MRAFISKLKELREEKGISGWEVGRNEPNQEMLIKIAAYFNVTIDCLLGATDEWGNVTISSGNITGNGNTVNSHNTIHTRTAPQLSDADADLLRKYHSAPAELRKAVDKLLS